MRVFVYVSVHVCACVSVCACLCVRVCVCVCVCCTCLCVWEEGGGDRRGEGGGLCGLPSSDCPICQPTILCTCQPGFQFYHHRRYFVCQTVIQQYWSTSCFSSEA